MPGGATCKRSFEWDPPRYWGALIDGISERRGGGFLPSRVPMKTAGNKSCDAATAAPLET